jgi:hypothetical protein
VTYYANAAITEPPQPLDDEDFVWPFRGEDWK